MSSILVTGGRGFIGANLVEKLLAAGHSVRVLDNNAYAGNRPVPESVDFIAGAVDSLDVLKAAFDGVDQCVHLAGTSILRDPRAELAVNRAIVFCGR